MSSRTCDFSGVDAADYAVVAGVPPARIAGSGTRVAGGIFRIAADTAAATGERL